MWKHSKFSQIVVNILPENPGNISWKLEIYWKLYLLICYKPGSMMLSNDIHSALQWWTAAAADDDDDDVYMQHSLQWELLLSSWLNLQPSLECLLVSSILLRLISYLFISRLSSLKVRIAVNYEIRNCITLLKISVISCNRSQHMRFCKMTDFVKSYSNFYSVLLNYLELFQ